MTGFFYVNVGLLGILLFFGGAGFFVSCLSNESRHAVGFTSVVVVYTILVQMISQVGDLAASAIKRNHDIKDYGKLIPGHGGILDRFDSVIFTAPIIYYMAVALMR